MKKTVSLIGFEIRACLRQLREAVHFGTGGLLLATAFCLTASAALAFFRLRGLNTDWLLAALLGVSFVFGLLIFNKKGAQDMLGGDKTQVFMAFPIDFGTLIFVKMEKLLFAACLIYGLVSAVLLAVMLLAGIGGVGLFLNFLCCLLAFAVGQNIRMTAVVYSGSGFGSAAAKITGAAAAVGIMFALKERSYDIPGLLAAAAEGYADNCGIILFGLFLVFAMLKLAMCLRRPKPVSRCESENEIAISPRVEKLIQKANFVTRRDLCMIFHSRKERRGFVSRLAATPLTIAAAALFIRLGVLPMEIAPDYCVWMLGMFAVTGMAGLFDRQFTMGFEGNMILGYILSGSRISGIQSLRVKGSVAITLPAVLIGTLAAGIILGVPVLKLAAALLLCSGALVLLTTTNAYYAIKGTDYLNDLNRPNMSSGIIGQMVQTAVDTLMMLPVFLAEFIPGDCYFLIAAAFAAVMAVLILIYFNKLVKGDAHYYGEYRTVAV